MPYGRSSCTYLLPMMSPKKYKNLDFRNKESKILSSIHSLFSKDNVTHPIFKRLLQVCVF